MATQIRKISFSNLKRCGRNELKFVYEDLGHLWLTYHGKNRAVIIPMRDEAILQRAIGVNPEVVWHRAQIDHDRRAAAFAERMRWQSEPVATLERLYPPVGVSDAQGTKVLEDKQIGRNPRDERARQIRAMYLDDE
ncbi:hypothetical protein [Tateyamaria sp. ANG-S1]|uniref:hypothetical protein n=1 Tax=Tateyamaria sp. ANG-S1 TaxID=1577905 RepID=UPI000580494F|nr:hypothetical protein [Tateyamaria sp. ANG-S1]KIC48226.1 hypothetical protein RA29_16960 [Tateyamaria sp. ANG-S1]